MACQWDVDHLTWRRLEYDGELWEEDCDNTEREGVTWTGDGLPDFEPVEEGAAPFKYGDYIKATWRLKRMIESGAGRMHECVMCRMPATVEMGSFLATGASEIPAERGKLFAKVRFTLMGAVEQKPGSRWEWHGAKATTLKVPRALWGIFGTEFRVDGWFKVWGEQASRKKGGKIRFKEREAGLC